MLDLLEEKKLTVTGGASQARASAGFGFRRRSTQPPSYEDHDLSSAPSDIDESDDERRGFRSTGDEARKRLGSNYVPKPRSKKDKKNAAPATNRKAPKTYGDKISKRMEKYFDARDELEDEELASRQAAVRRRDSPEYSKSGYTGKSLARPKKLANTKRTSKGNVKGRKLKEISREWDAQESAAFVDSGNESEVPEDPSPTSTTASSSNAEEEKGSYNTEEGDDDTGLGEDEDEEEGDSDEA